MQNETEASAIAAVKRLGAMYNAGSVAVYLAEQGIRGELGRALACPLAVYLCRESDYMVCVAAESYYTDMDYCEHPLPPVLVEFVRLFDEGQFPSLEGEAGDPQAET